MAVVADGRDCKALEDLVVQVVRQQDAKAFLPGHERIAGLVGNKIGEPQAYQKHNEQREPGQGARITERQPLVITL